MQAVDVFFEYRSRIELTKRVTHDSRDREVSRISGLDLWLSVYSVVKRGHMGAFSRVGGLKLTVIGVKRTISKSTKETKVPN